MKQHPLDPISLVFGGLFTALSLFLIVSDARWERVGAAWLLPVVLVAMGGIILWSTLRQLTPAPDGEDQGDEQPVGELVEVEIADIELPEIPEI